MCLSTPCGPSLPGHMVEVGLRLRKLDQSVPSLSACVTAQQHGGSGLACTAPATPLHASLFALQVRVFYTAPTLIRALEAADHKYVRQHDRSSLRILGTVGEPINEGAWRWFHQVCG